MSDKKQSPIIRVAQVKSPTTGKMICLRVTADGRIAGRRYVQQYKVAKVATWVEVEAQSWARATKAVKAGRGKRVRTSKAA